VTLIFHPKGLEKRSPLHTKTKHTKNVTGNSWLILKGNTELSLFKNTLKKTGT
jgi:hypothetical protein